MHAGKYLLGLIVGVVVNTAAADVKVFPATECQLWGGDRHLSSYLSYSQFGKLSNTHPNKRISVVCPLVRDRPDKRMDLAVYWTDAYKADNGNVSKFSCRLRSNSLWGSSSHASSGVDSSNWGDTSFPLDGSGINVFQRGRFWWTNLFGVTSTEAFNYETSTYTLFCSIPPLYMGNESYLGSYVIREN